MKSGSLMEDPRIAELTLEFQDGQNSRTKCSNELVLFATDLSSTSVDNIKSLNK